MGQVNPTSKLVFTESEKQVQQVLLTKTLWLKIKKLQLNDEENIKKLTFHCKTVVAAINLVRVYAKVIKSKWRRK